MAAAAPALDMDKRDTAGAKRLSPADHGPWSVMTGGARLGVVRVLTPGAQSAHKAMLSRVETPRPRCRIEDFKADLALHLSENLSTDLPLRTAMGRQERLRTRS